MSLLEIKDLTLRFAGKDVVKHVSFSIAKGEMLAVVGESGQQIAHCAFHAWACTRRRCYHWVDKA